MEQRALGGLPRMGLRTPEAPPFRSSGPGRPWAHLPLTQRGVDCGEACAHMFLGSPHVCSAEPEGALGKLRVSGEPD